MKDKTILFLVKHWDKIIFILIVLGWIWLASSWCEINHDKNGSWSVKKTENKIPDIRK